MEVEVIIWINLASDGSSGMTAFGGVSADGEFLIVGVTWALFFV
jgi:hypothetical protein